MKRDKKEKKWAVVNRWLPAINALRAQRNWPRWDFLELDEETAVKDSRTRISLKLRETPNP